MQNEHQIIGRQGIMAVQRILSIAQTMAIKHLSLYDMNCIIKNLMELKKSIIENNDFEKQKD